MEYSAEGVFEDRATQAIVNRKLPVPKFSQSSENGILTITTDSVTLAYTIGEVFGKDTLSVKSTDPSSAFESWHYGQHDALNLLGTIRTLDGLGVTSLNCSENAGIKPQGESLHCEWGLVSRAGWATIDDSGAPNLDKEYWWSDWGREVDVYLLAHGHDYAAALGDFVQIGGRIAMVPRYAMGVWFTRWFNYDNADLDALVAKSTSRDIPMDVMVLDMNWHTKHDWTGYTFDRNLYPHPADTMADMHNKGLYVAVNLHDADGVQWWEDAYEPMCAVAGVDPASKQPVPLDLFNKTRAYALEDLVLGPLRDDTGVDFWWIDWQQGPNGGGLAGGKQNPTLWLNHLRHTDLARQGSDKRGMLFGRWGGLGNHRYQVGFSGDVAGLTWQNLAYQPYFSATAANVGYGFWSHDIVGPSSDLELYTRWVQWGANSGVMRSHDRGMSAGDCMDDNPPSCGIVEIWRLESPYFDACRGALQWREALVPYLYTMARVAFDAGLGLTRPMYYEAPESDQAYQIGPDGRLSQYLLGSELVVAPVVAPASDTGLADKDVLIPPGQWLELHTGTLRTGDSTQGTLLSTKIDLSEVPVYVRGGAVLPTRLAEPGLPLTGVAMRVYSALVVTVYPGAAEGQFELYEDDGLTTGYLDGAAARTKLAYTRDGSSLSFQLHAQGSFQGFPSTRRVSLRVVNAAPPSKVTAGGQDVPFARFGGDNTWHFDAQLCAVVVDLAAVPTDSFSVTLSLPGAPAAMDGLRGRLAHAAMAKELLDEDRSAPGQASGNPEAAPLSLLAAQAAELEFYADDIDGWTSVVEGIASKYADAVSEVQQHMPDQGDRKFPRWNHALNLLLATQ